VLAVLRAEIIVGHAGEVIAHGAVQAGRPDPLLRGFADLLRVLEKMAEQVNELLFRPEMRLVDDGVEIQIFVEVTAQFPVQRAARRTVSSFSAAASAKDCRSRPALCPLADGSYLPSNRAQTTAPERPGPIPACSRLAPTT